MSWSLPFYSVLSFCPIWFVFLFLTCLLLNLFLTSVFFSFINLRAIYTFTFLLVVIVEIITWILFNMYIILFIFGCAGLVCGLSCGKQGLLSSCDEQTSHYIGFSCCRAWALGVQTSVVVVYGLSSCSTWTQ